MVCIKRQPFVLFRKKVSKIYQYVLLLNPIEISLTCLHQNLFMVNTFKLNLNNKKIKKTFE